MIYPEHKEVLKDNRGRFRTQSLFHEFREVTPKYTPLWTLNADVKDTGLPSLHQLYMECGDPTEYSFAMAAFGNWKQWLKIKSNNSIKAWIEDWPIELEVKLRSEAIQVIANEAKNGKTPFNAAKFLAKKDWETPLSKRGRPSKEEIAKEVKIAAKLDAEVGEDAERLGLRIVSGNE